MSVLRQEILDGLHDRIGQLSVAALEKGGEDLLTSVEFALGVALRHSERIANGTMPFAHDVERDMRASIARAERILAAADHPNAASQPRLVHCAICKTILDPQFGYKGEIHKVLDSPAREMLLACDDHALVLVLVQVARGKIPANELDSFVAAAKDPWLLGGPPGDVAVIEGPIGSADMSLRCAICRRDIGPESGYDGLRTFISDRLPGDPVHIGLHACADHALLLALIQVARGRIEPSILETFLCRG